MAIPDTRLSACLVLAAAAGVLAAVGPARRAANVESYEPSPASDPPGAQRRGWPYRGATPALLAHTAETAAGTDRGWPALGFAGHTYHRTPPSGQCPRSGALIGQGRSVRGELAVAIEEGR